MPRRKTTEDELLQKCIEVFRRRGYNGTSMKELADACGLTKGLFYHYFPSKKAIMEQALANVLSYFRYACFSRVCNPELSYSQKQNMFENKLLQLFTYHDGGCIMANTVLESMHTNPEFREPVKAFFSEWRDALAVMYQDVLSEEESREKAMASIADIEGSVIMMRLYEDSSYLRSALKRTRVV